MAHLSWIGIRPAALTRDALNDALTHWLRAEGLNAIGWNSGTAGLLARLQFLYRARPELFNIAPYETDLLEHSRLGIALLAWYDELKTVEGMATK